MHRMFTLSLASAFALALSTVGVAHAQLDDDDDDTGAVDPCGEDPLADGDGDDDSPLSASMSASTGEGSGAGAPGHGLTLPKDKIALTVPVEISLSADNAFKPVSIAPDVWYGVNDKLSVGLTHSTLGVTGFFGFGAGGLGGAGASLCVTGDDGNCAGIYNNVGVDAMYVVKESESLQLAANGGIQVISISDPFAVAAKVGVKGIWTSGKIGVMFNPSIFAGLTGRTVDAGGGIEVGVNEEFLNVPVTAGYPVAPEIYVMLQTGVRAPVADFVDLFVIPLSLAGNYKLNDRTIISAAFSLPALVNQVDGLGAFDTRSITIMASYMM